MIQAQDAKIKILTNYVFIYVYQRNDYIYLNLESKKV